MPFQRQCRSLYVELALEAYQWRHKVRRIYPLDALCNSQSDAHLDDIQPSRLIMQTHFALHSRSFWTDWRKRPATVVQPAHHRQGLPSRITALCSAHYAYACDGYASLAPNSFGLTVPIIAEKELKQSPLRVTNTGCPGGSLWLYMSTRPDSLSASLPVRWKIAFGPLADSPWI